MDSSVNLMDTEELIRRCESISLEEAEENKLSFKGRVKERGAQIAAGCLIGKVLHARNVNTRGVKSCIESGVANKEGSKDRASWGQHFYFQVWE